MTPTPRACAERTSGWSEAVEALVGLGSRRAIVVGGVRVVLALEKNVTLWRSLILVMSQRKSDLDHLVVVAVVLGVGADRGGGGDVDFLETVLDGVALSVFDYVALSVPLSCPWFCSPVMRSVHFRNLLLQ